MFLKDAVTEYGFDCRIRKLSPNTVNNYTKQLRYFLEFLEQNYSVIHLEEVKRTHIKGFLAMMDSKQRKPQYINDLLKVIRTFFRYAVREEHIRVNPADGIKNVKQPKVKIITFSELEIRRMLNYYHGRDYLSTRNRTMIALFFDTGTKVPVNDHEIVELPVLLTHIDANAFENDGAIRVVVVPDGTQSIGSRAFAHCDRLRRIHIPESVTDISGDAFKGAEQVLIVTTEGSFAQQFAQDKGMDCFIENLE